MITAHIHMLLLYFLVSLDQLRIHPSFLPSFQPTNQILTHPLHSTLPDLRSRMLCRRCRLSDRRQERARGKRVDRNLSSVCLSCCPPTMIDSLPRSSAIQRGTDADERTDGRTSDSFSRSIFGDSRVFTASNLGCNSRESIALPDT